jgi:hypothetical protein
MLPAERSRCGEVESYRRALLLVLLPMLECRIGLDGARRTCTGCDGGRYWLPWHTPGPVYLCRFIFLCFLACECGLEFGWMEIVFLVGTPGA